MGTVIAGIAVTHVSAGRSVLGAVTAGRDVGSVRAGGGGFWTPSADPDHPEDGYWTAYAPGGVLGPVIAGRDVHAVAATGSVVGAVTAGGHVGVVNADEDVVGAVTAAGDVGGSEQRPADPDWRPGWFSWSTWSWGSFLPRGGGVYAVLAIGGTIEATGGPIGRLTDEPVAGNSSGYEFPYSSESPAPGKVHAGGAIDADLTAGGDITRVEAGGDIAGSVTSSRDIGAVVSDHSVLAAVDAGRDVGTVLAGTPDPGGTPTRPPASGCSRTGLPGASPAGCGPTAGRCGSRRGAS